MVRLRLGLLANGIAGLTAILAVAARSLPQPLAAPQAAARVGGCGSGLCGSQSSLECAEVGDGCGIYEQCLGTPDGPYICTPGKYCTSAGCTATVGGTCY